MSEILALLFSVVIALSQAPKLMVWVQTANDNTRAAATAEQQKKLIDASTRYIQQYSTNLQAVATPTTSAIVTVPMLQAVQLLDVSFSATNPFGQTWQTEVLQPTPGKLSALVLSSGGQTMDDKAASKIATLVGQAGGFIPKNNSGIYASSVAYGSYGGWALPTAGYTLAAGGHLAAMLSFTSGQLASNYLYRNAVPGQPQLNRMGTDLDLGTNNLNNAASITSNGRVTAGEYVQIKGVAVENTACSSNDLFARDATNLLLSCQSGAWNKGASSGASMPLHLDTPNGYTIPTECPDGWEQVALGMVLGGGGYGMNRRTCVTNRACSVLHFDTPNSYQTPENCPAGWNQVDLAWVLGGGGYSMKRRSCVSC